MASARRCTLVTTRLRLSGGLLVNVTSGVCCDANAVLVVCFVCCFF